MTRWLSLLSLLSLVACLDPLEGDGDACDLADEHQGCDDCTTGPTTCTFGDTSVTENSCGDCQARSALYNQLCDDGETASADEIEADTVCMPIRVDS